MVSGISGIRYNISKANRTDGRVQNLAAYIDKEMLRVIHRKMKPGKASGIDRVTKEGYEVYLHYVLNLWLEKIVKCRMRGQCYLIRYADDFICCFQYKDEAEMFLKVLKRRFAKFRLELAEEKAKILEFGRFAAVNRKNRGEGKPEVFDFLRFTFYCGKANKKGFFRCRVKTSKKKFVSKLRTMKEWMKYMLYKWLNRRSQKKSYSITAFLATC